MNIIPLWLENSNQVPTAWRSVNALILLPTSVPKTSILKDFGDLEMLCLSPTAFCTQQSSHSMLRWLLALTLPFGLLYLF